MKFGISTTILLLAFGTISFTQCLDGDCIDGHGRFQLLSGAVYEGNFFNGMIEGQGICTFSNGSYFSGNWHNRLPNGPGEFVDTEGYSCSGIWKNGRLTNQDSIACRPNLLEIQTGCVIGDCLNGHGVFAYADGSIFKGSFKNARAHGQGQLQYPNGTSYTGAFKQSLFQGKGLVELPNGQIKKGIWENGEKVLDELHLEGCVSGDCSNGAGKYYFKDANAVYEGVFQNTLPNGFGICNYENGERYIGQWKDGSYHGMGVLMLVGGTEVYGWWTDGVYSGDFMEKPGSNVLSKVIKSASTLRILIIGIASYSKMPALKYADDDAYRLYAFFRSAQGGAIPEANIELLIDEDATKENILRAVDALGAAKENDIVLIFYSGHGMQNALLPIDFNGYYNRLPYSILFDRLKNCAAKQKIWISDACYSGSFGQHVADEEYSNRTDVTMVLSSKPEEISLESKGLRQGVFSYFLLHGIKGHADTNQDKQITLQELSDYLNREVAQYTDGAQHPSAVNIPVQETPLFRLD